MILKNLNIVKNKLKLTFVFFSYFNPYCVANLKLLLNINSIKTKKLKVKQSYLLLTWLFYLSANNNKNINKNKNVKFFILPKKRTNFTLTKAPMAHKNWSKEQYKFLYYKFKISFKTTNLSYLPANLNYFIFLILNIKLNLNLFETNLFFIKNYTLITKITDSIFFKRLK